MENESEIIEDMDEKERKKSSKSKLVSEKKEIRTNEIDSLNFLVHQYFKNMEGLYS